MSCCGASLGQTCARKSMMSFLLPLHPSNHNPDGMYSYSKHISPHHPLLCFSYAVTNASYIVTNASYVVTDAS